MKTKKLRIVIESMDEFFTGFKTAWKAAEHGKRVEKKDEMVLSFPSFEILSRFLTKERWKLLKVVREKHPKSVNELAKILDRAQSNVHRDVHALADMGVLELKKVKENGSKKVLMQPACDWDRVEIPLVA